LKLTQLIVPADAVGGAIPPDSKPFSYPISESIDLRQLLSLAVDQLHGQNSRSLPPLPIFKFHQKITLLRPTLQILDPQIPLQILPKNFLLANSKINLSPT
jgi:hypothetical protein